MSSQCLYGYRFWIDCIRVLILWRVKINDVKRIETNESIKIVRI